MGERDDPALSRPLKSRQAYRTISEVSLEIDVPQHVLRFWETKFTQIRPLKRGGGRRYYRPEDVALLKGIRHLLYGDGYTIRGVQKVLKESGARAVIQADDSAPLPLAVDPADSAVPPPDDSALDPGITADSPAEMPDDSAALAAENALLRRVIHELRAELIDLRALLKRRK